MAGALTLRDPTSGAACEVDGIALALVNIDTVHRKIHQGEVFTASAPGVTKSNFNSHYILMTVPADIVAHVSFSVFVSGDVELEVQSNPGIVSDVGDLLTSINRNRASSNTAAVTVHGDSEVAIGGFAIGNRFVPGGSPPSSNGQFSPAFEWIFPEEQYLLRIISRGGDVVSSAQVFWYEEAA